VRASELERARAAVVIDRRRVVRRVPLQLAGEVPADLEAVQAAPRPAGRMPMFALAGDHVQRHAGELWLVARDEHAHEVFVVHPDTLPAAATLPGAKAPATPVAVTLRRGTPCTLRVAFPDTLLPHERPRLLVRTAGIFASVVGCAEIRDPALAGARPGVAVTVRAPFALPTGRLELTILRDHRQGTRKVTVGADPVEVDFGVLSQ
jgi:hypothetical protein